MPLTIPDFTLPTMLARLGRRLPQWPHTLALTLALNVATRLGLLPSDELAELDGKHFLIEVEDSGSSARFTATRGRFAPDFSVPPPDLILRASLSTFLKLLNRQEDPDTLFFQRALVIEGDTELGLRVKNMLDAVDWSSLVQGFRVSMALRALPR